jgi:pimeloyl-ACP methyl ester carboxylesterase
MLHDHETWQLVQDSMSKSNLTVSYDRARLGKTAYVGQKKDLITIADELHQLIMALNLPKPVILVGHSMGCQVIRQYASVHPKDVKAIVFVDPGYNPDKLKAVISDSLWLVRDKKLKSYLPKMNAGQQGEFDNLVSNSVIADSIKTFPNIPTVMLTATLVTDFPASATEIEVKKKSHENWLRGLTQARHVIVTSTWHYIHTDAPDEVIKAIRSFI